MEYSTKKKVATEVKQSQARKKKIIELKKQ